MFILHWTNIKNTVSNATLILDTDENTSVLPVFAWTLAGSGIVYWILVFFGTYMKIFGTYVFVILEKE